MKKILALMTLSASLICSAATVINVYDMSPTGMPDVIIGDVQGMVSTDQITQTVTTNATDIPSGAAVTAAFDSWMYQVTTNPVVQTVSGDETNAVPSVAAVNDAFAGKADVSLTNITANLIETKNFSDAITIGIFGQSKSVFTYGGITGLEGEMLTGVTNTFQVARIDTQTYVQTNIAYTTTNTWSIEIPMSKNLRDRTGKTIYIARGGRSSTSITNFMSGGPYHYVITNSLEQLSAIFPSSGKLDAVCWMQGETDSDYTTNAVEYLSNLRIMLSQIRSQPNVSSNTPIFINDIQPATGTVSLVYLYGIRNAFFELAKEDPYVFVVTNADIAVSADKAHFDTTGQIALGNRFADYIYNYLSNNAAMSQGSVKSERVSTSELVADRITMTDGFEITDHLIPVSEKGLMCYAPLRGSFADVSTNAHTNAVNGTIVWTDDEFGEYAQITNVSYALIYNFPTITNTDFTVSIAVKRTWGELSGSRNDILAFSSGFSISGGTSSTNTYVSITPRFTIKGSLGESYGAREIGAQWTSNEFDRIAVSVDRNGTGSVIKTYFDGVLIGQLTPTNDLSVTSGSATTYLTLGGTATNTFINGGMRDVTVYSRVLSDKEIERLHAIQKQNRSGIRGIN